MFPFKLKQAIIQNGEFAQFSYIYIYNNNKYGLFVQLFIDEFFQILYHLLEQTINNVVQTFDNFSMVKYTGGGIIGALLSAAFVSMFDITGTLIVCGVFFIFGIIMLFDITLSDVFKFLIKPFKKKPKSIEEMAKIGETELDNKEAEEDNKVVITNINELPIQKPAMTHLEEVTYEEKEIKNNEPYVLPPEVK